MEAHRKWLSGHCQKTIGYLNPGDEYNAGTREGFRAALEWTRKHAYGRNALDVIRIINKELEDR